MHPLRGRAVHPGVQGEGEGIANGEGAVETLAPVGQCLAKIQTLSHKGGLFFTYFDFFYSNFICK